VNGEGEVIEGHAVRLNGESQAEITTIEAGWGGETPFFLIIEIEETGERIGVDLDSPWTTTHAKYLREPGTWWLTDKDSSRVVMAVIVEPGDQPYFTKHHVGNLMVQRELVAFGLGKKRADGTMVRNWLLPNGIICGGDDVDIIASRMLNQ
jgi:hypothetical protein